MTITLGLHGSWGRNPPALLSLLPCLKQGEGLICEQISDLPGFPDAECGMNMAGQPCPTPWICDAHVDQGSAGPRLPQSSPFRYFNIRNPAAVLHCALIAKNDP